jgi:pyruvate formate lyase activating enzyme
VQCDVCPRACKLRPGGLCFVRGRPEAGDPAGDGVALLTYGRSSGYCVTRSKKPLNHTCPASVCRRHGRVQPSPVRQNWTSQVKEMDTLADAAGPGAIAAAAQPVPASPSYNDPTIFLE